MSENEQEHTSVGRAQRLTIRNVLAGLPARFEDKYEALVELNRVFHEELAAALQPVLRAQVNIQPRASIEDRTLIASMLSQTLKSLGLTLRCPKTNEPGYVTTDDERIDPDLTPSGRFQFVVPRLCGGPLVSLVTDDVPTLHVTSSPEPHEPTFRWARPSSSSSRTR